MVLRRGGGRGGREGREGGGGRERGGEGERESIQVYIVYSWIAGLDNCSTNQSTDIQAEFDSHLPLTQSCHSLPQLQV